MLIDLLHYAVIVKAYSREISSRQARSVAKLFSSCVHQPFFTENTFLSLFQFFSFVAISKILESNFSFVAPLISCLVLLSVVAHY